MNFSADAQSGAADHRLRVSLPNPHTGESVGDLRFQPTDHPPRLHAEQACSLLFPIAFVQDAGWQPQSAGVQYRASANLKTEFVVRPLGRTTNLSREAS